MQKWANSGAGPVQVKRFNHALSELNWENNTYVELTGVIGLSERSSVCSMLGGRDTRADVTAAQESIGERFNWTVTKENVKDILKALAEALATVQTNRPVHDNRTTPDAEAARQEAYTRTAAEAKAKAERSAAAFTARYGSGEKVTLQLGQMAVLAQICYDNSDTMSDYFDRHTSLSQAFVLAIVPKQSETERLARRGAAASPLLSAIDFEWHTEKYSMGHGNYLESKESFELPAELQNLRTNYGTGDGVKRAHWEITFTYVYREPVTLDAIAGFGQTEPKPTKAPVDGVTVSENEEKDGLEIRFPSKPSADVLDSLKAAGWRWSRFSQCWYARRSDTARQFANSLSGPAKPKAGEKSPAPASSLSSRFRTWADALQPKIDLAGRPMTQNPTPKRNCQYQNRMHDCRNMERAQKALRALADAHDTGNVPAELIGLRARNEIGAMVCKHLDNSQGVYYSCIEAADYADKAPAARLLQTMIEGNSEQQAEQERLRKIEALKAEIALSTIPGYFPTPAPVVSLILNQARLEPGQTVLEPSAGSGNIADAVLEEFPSTQIHCFELNRKLAGLLKLKGYYVGGDDFLADEQVACIYDRILMNPPFEKQADIDHVRKAFSVLKPHGILVSVMAPGFEFRQDRKSQDFRQWLVEAGGEWEDLPEGSFKASGTGASTKLMVIEKGAAS